MKDEDEIRRLCEQLENADTEGRIHSQGDTFQNGMLAGKLTALAWVLHEVFSNDMAIQYDFADWQRECTRMAEDLRGKLNDPESKGPQP